MIPAPTLTALRAAANKTLDQTCTIQRASLAPDGYGQNTETWGTAPGGNNVKVRLDDPSLQVMQTYADLIGTRQAYMLLLPQGQDVQQFDRVVVASMTLTVQVPRVAKSNQILLQVLATRIS